MIKLSKIIREELENKDFEWIGYIDPLNPGNKFDSEEICFKDINRYNVYKNCEVNISTENIVFFIDLNEFYKYFNISEEESWYLEPILYHGREYDGGGGYYELDSDEFNYTGGFLTDEQKERFNNILNIINSEDTIDYFIDSQSMNSLVNVFMFDDIRYIFWDLQSEVLSTMGYVIERNKWLELSEFLHNELNKSGIEAEIFSNHISLSISMDKVFELVSSGYDDLTKIYDYIGNIMDRFALQDYYYDIYDTSGSEDQIKSYFDDFLDNVEDFLDNEDLLKIYNKEMDIINKNGFKRKSDYTNKFIKENIKDKTVWLLYKNTGEGDKYILELYSRNIYRKQLNRFKINIEELTNYVNNYRLDID